MPMRFWTAYAFLFLSSITKSFAAGGGHGADHHGSITDLIAPTVNVAILFGVLIWKLKGPLNEYFTKLSADVKNTLERADMKSREAAMMLQNEERKIANLPAELKSIQTQSENEVIAFEKALAKETEEKSHKLKTDAQSKIAADKKNMIDELNAELLEQVIQKTKSAIGTNKDYQTKVSSKLLQGL